MQQIIDWSKGNPGALDFLMQVMDIKNKYFAISIVLKLEQCPTIRGTNLYVLFNDLCNRNMATVAELCKNCPNDILEDACSRQDRSGVALIQEYINH
jgi:hypothetical protein